MQYAIYRREYNTLFHVRDEYNRFRIYDNFEDADRFTQYLNGFNQQGVTYVTLPYHEKAI